MYIHLALCQQTRLLTNLSKIFPLALFSLYYILFIFVKYKNVLKLFRNLNFWWQLNHSNVEHVRIVIDQNQECDQNNNTASFLIVSLITSIKMKHYIVRL